MCGITGIFAFNLVGKFNRINISAATLCLEKRGPDFQDIYIDEWVGLGHRRLSIIDTSQAGHQPMWDETGRYCIVFNGEIFNFRELRTWLEQKGCAFKSHSDTEVLLKLYIHERDSFLEKLNGFFSFCIYDKAEQTFFLARDRYGVKPLLYLFDEDKFIFASEMKSVIQYGINKSLDYTSLYTYLQLNYIPAPQTIFENVKKLLPGHCMKVSRNKLETRQYYSIPYNPEHNARQPIGYETAKQKFASLLEASVERRLIADVPLGAFLSGGIDSSVIVALASRHKRDLHTFSIGYRDEKFFDETSYAHLVARKFNTHHTTFSLSNDDLYAHIDNILNYIDEPFADSSAIAVYILSKETRKHATVALSGDGADELLGGYNKHAAFYRIIHAGWKAQAVKSGHFLWKILPKSRSNYLSDKVRQLLRFSEGMRLSSRERYWRWAGYAGESEALQLMEAGVREKVIKAEYDFRKNILLGSIPENESINDILLTDTRMVLPNDMLTKVDLMSMAHGLEIRTPFLDYEVVDFAFSLPGTYKINGRLRKKILQDTFRETLPAELYNRPKKGFEVPMLQWLRTKMKTRIMDDLLQDDFIVEQGLFDPVELKRLKKRLFSANPGDIHARLWALVVFQTWWRKYVS